MSLHVVVAMPETMRCICRENSNDFDQNTTYTCC
jgi:hypothetical protein